MSLRARLSRLEKRTASDRTVAELEPWTDAMRVQALRNIAKTAARSEAGDPYPHLEGEEYLKAFWAWFWELENGATWLQSLQEAACRIGSPQSPYAARSR